MTIRPRLRHHRSRPIAAVAFAVIVIALITAGCALHRNTPQQQFTGALMRGNAAQASYIWNNMSPQDRAAFIRGDSISPQVDPHTAAAQVLEHQTGEGVQDGSDDPPATVEIPAD